MTSGKEENFRTFVLADIGSWATAERSEDLSSQFERIGPNSGFLLDGYPRLVVMALERLAIMLVVVIGTIMARRALRRR